MPKPIYVPTREPISAGSSKLLAIRPAGKGEKKNYVLTGNGFSYIEGSRINGVSYETFLKENGYIPGDSTNPDFVKLADKINTREGLKMVEDASFDQSTFLEKRFGGQLCHYVPFDVSKPIQRTTVAEYVGIGRQMISADTALSTGCVKVESVLGNPEVRGWDISLSEGWLVGPEDDPKSYPRSTEYGGLVERAAYFIANSGVATLGDIRNLAASSKDDEFPRGRMELDVTGAVVGKEGDKIIIGINGADELEVQYVRDGNIIAKREGLESFGSRLSLGSAVGSLAGVLPMIAELDAAPEPKKKKLAKPR